MSVEFISALLVVVSTFMQMVLACCGNIFLLVVGLSFLCYGLFSKHKMGNKQH